MRPDITDQGASAAQPASPVEGNSSASMDRFFVWTRPLIVLATLWLSKISSRMSSPACHRSKSETLVPSPEADSLGGDPPRRSEGPLEGSGGSRRMSCATGGEG